MTNNPEPNNGYTYPEKLALVSRGLMAPEEVGCATAEEAQALQVMPDPPKQAFLGDYCQFEVSEVPLKLRCLWAKQDSKIINGFDEEDWMEKNKGTHLLQARLRCGNVGTMLEQTYTDVVAGFALMLAAASEVLTKMKESYDKGEMNPPVKEDPLQAQKAKVLAES